ncbi:phospholipid phosphatase 2-like isoform X1 [Pieris napi]|uniref:phospholipid phosphatase 2-like isoform X1 n=2 Tax=Pieris napi TaxID=78633 RepID=UPI001FB9E182|nr:phospholipid phosphatase 2-like isoform X1 [Pieris napi]
MVRTYKVIGCFKMPRRSKVVPAPPGEGVFTIDMSSTSTLDIATVTQPAPPVEMQARRNLLWNLLIDLPILLLVAAVCILLEVGALPSRQSGFRCNDPDLSFPHTGDTMSISLVAAVTVIVPFVIMWAVEAALHRDDEYTLKKSKLSESAQIAALMYRDYIYGAIVNLTIMEIVKCVVGSPRPTFFDLCEPDKASTCNDSEYVTSYTCTSTRYSRYLQIDASRSFPSAHTSLAVYCGLFLAWYLQRRAFSWHNRSVLIVPLVQILCIIYAVICPLTRITDRRHHWWDVLAGAVMGFCSVLYTVLVLCKNFSQTAVVSTSDISSSDGNNHQAVRRLLSHEPRVVVP